MPFVKGQSGNPAGRKKGSRGKWTLLTARLRKALEATTTDADGNKTTELDLVIQAVLLRAKMGDVQAASFIADRVEGKPVQAHLAEVKQTGPPENLPKSPAPWKPILGTGIPTIDRRLFPDGADGDGGDDG